MYFEIGDYDSLNSGHVGSGVRSQESGVRRANS